MSKRSSSSPVSSSHRVGSDTPTCGSRPGHPGPSLGDFAVTGQYSEAGEESCEMSWRAVEELWVVCSPVKFLKSKMALTTQTSVSFLYSVAPCQSLLLVRRTKVLPVVHWAHLLPAMLAPVSLGCHEFLLNCEPFPNTLLLGRCRPHSGHAPRNAVLWSLPAPNSLATLIELWGQLPPV